MEATVPSNRSAQSGKFKYPNRAIVPGETKPNVKHLDLTDQAKPMASLFGRPSLGMDQGQQRTSPSNTKPSDASE